MDHVFSPGQAGDGGPGRVGVRAALARAQIQFGDALRRHNPFYLLSAACMLAGCLLLTNSMSWNPIALSRLVTLLVALQVYELLLLGLGLYLVVRRRRGGQFAGPNADMRDSAQLLILWAVFMADAAFLVSEVVSSGLFAGVVVSTAVFAGFLVKATVLVRVLRIRVGVGLWAAGILAVFALLAIPCVLKAVGDTRVGPGHLYIAWWVATAVWAVWDVAAFRGTRGEAGDCPTPPHVLLVVIPWLSLITHIGILHYVYDTPFTAPHATPVLLALVLVLSRLPAPDKDTDRARKALRIVMLVLAAWVSFRPLEHLALEVSPGTYLQPWAASLAAVYLTSVWVFAPGFIGRAIVAGVVAGAGYLFGPTGGQISATLRSVLGTASSTSTAVWDAVASAGRWAWGFAPRSPLQWGVLAMSSSFVLLGIGARISFKKHDPAAAPSLPAPPGLPAGE